MVWGMVSPSSFGEFWPQGDPEGVDERGACQWYKRLRAHYEAQSPARRRELFSHDGSLAGAAHEYSCYVAEKFTHELGTASGPDRPRITAINESEPPRFYAMHKKPNSLGSFIALSALGWAVDEKLKTIIEELEPGRHQFFPIAIKMSQEKIFPQSYHILVIDKYIESLSPEGSKEGSCKFDGRIQFNNVDHYFFKGTKSGVSGLALEKASFGAAHLWHERCLGQSLMCMSDALQSAITHADLRIPKHYRMIEI